MVPIYEMYFDPALIGIKTETKFLGRCPGYINIAPKGLK
jgi:hypothetical protein